MKKEKTNLYSLVSLVLAFVGLISILASVIWTKTWLGNIGFCLLIPGVVVSALMRYNGYMEANDLN
ncbi:MAG: hypothetical protein ILP17_02370 [Lachnospiraceae bacterium]|nr:hypothetical protein [Lachnospiraceae bacterium]